LLGDRTSDVNVIGRQMSDVYSILHQLIHSRLAGSFQFGEDAALHSGAVLILIIISIKKLFLVNRRLKARC
jgi:hypothetical protein